jgi:hypothetical protein
LRSVGLMPHLAATLRGTRRSWNDDGLRSRLQSTTMI